MKPLAKLKRLVIPLDYAHIYETHRDRLSPEWPDGYSNDRERNIDRAVADVLKAVCDTLPQLETFALKVDNEQY